MRKKEQPALYVLIRKMQETVADKLIENVQSLSHDESRRRLASYASFPKLSETILEFAAPLINNEKGEVVYEAGIHVAILVWDIALLPPAKSEKAIRLAIAHLAPEFKANEDLERKMLYMLDRKRNLFAADWRPVIKYFIRQRPGKMGVTTRTIINIGFRPSAAEKGDE
ncbi:MAG: hypothetical protein NTX50_18305 [Candidatus Sumerlaeota bacterium]|nr:hypothetical protein [Candidatus Sumerlaeota bacterium]